ncbi:uncharacterized protein LOC130590635 [Beta vulgaris subsp. vulgaris]|uniref:uncharacterized protein LOC130590635 n=1 Tax=Beta vulgaris subsp. vulgaris TaxID=3555 RepID=UPI002547B80A|nr:uncharacterized protein LOC130590635 [Beta vulgaris subsp. vulgaris]
MALAHPYSAEIVAQCYLDNVFKLHGWPRSIISDRDSVFLSKFWQALFTIQGTDLLLSSAYHPQTDGQTEIVNKCVSPFETENLKVSTSEKLSPRYFGPFKVITKVGKVAYKLQLPDNAQVHPVFHVSQLKQCRGDLPTITHIPAWLQGTSATSTLQPAAILEKRVVKHQNTAQVQYLVQWEGCPISEATWEWAQQFESSYPTFSIP